MVLKNFPAITMVKIALVVGDGQPRSYSALVVHSLGSLSSTWNLDSQLGASWCGE